MFGDHVSFDDTGLSPRSVTRRGALRLLIGAGTCAALLPTAAGAAASIGKTSSSARPSPGGRGLPLPACEKRRSPWNG